MSEFEKNILLGLEKYQQSLDKENVRNAFPKAIVELAFLRAILLKKGIITEADFTPFREEFDQCKKDMKADFVTLFTECLADLIKK